MKQFDFQFDNNNIGRIVDNNNATHKIANHN